MSTEKIYSLKEVCEILQIPPDTIYRWENTYQDLRPSDQNTHHYSGWELDLLKYTKKSMSVYGADPEKVMVAIQQWIKTHPRPMIREDQEKLFVQNQEQSIDSFWNQDVFPREQEIHPQDPFYDAFDPMPNQQPNINPEKAKAIPPSYISPPSVLQTEAPMSIISEYQPVETPQHRLSQFQPSASTQNQVVEPQLPKDDAESNDILAWKRAFHRSQTELANVRADLSKARETIHQQQHTLKQTAADFNALKELIRREIYNLKDLVVDKF